MKTGVLCDLTSKHENTDHTHQKPDFTRSHTFNVAYGCIGTHTRSEPQDRRDLSPKGGCQYKLK